VQQSKHAWRGLVREERETKTACSAKCRLINRLVFLKMLNKDRNP
jgi:hypothetical protein